MSVVRRVASIQPPPSTRRPPREPASRDRPASLASLLLCPNSHSPATFLARADIVRRSIIALDRDVECMVRRMWLVAWRFGVAS
jgi:hypothetical protein